MSPDEIGMIVVVVLIALMIYFLVYRRVTFDLVESRENVATIQKNLDSLVTLDLVYPNTLQDVDRITKALISDLKKLSSDDRKTFCNRLDEKYIYSQIKLGVCITMKDLGHTPHVICSETTRPNIKEVIALLEWMYIKKAQALTVRIGDRKFAVTQFKDTKFTSDTRAKLQTIASALDNLTQMVKSEICYPELNLEKTERVIRSVLFHKLRAIPPEVANIIATSPVVSALPAETSTPAAPPAVTAAINNAASAGASAVIDSRSASATQTGANTAVVVSSLQAANKQVAEEARAIVPTTITATNPVVNTTLPPVVPTAPSTAVAQEVNSLTMQKTAADLARPPAPIAAPGVNPTALGFNSDQYDPELDDDLNSG